MKRNAYNEIYPDNSLYTLIKCLMYNSPVHNAHRPEDAVGLCNAPELCIERRTLASNSNALAIGWYQYMVTNTSKLNKN